MEVSLADDAAQKTLVESGTGKLLHRLVTEKKTMEPAI
jgi:hypothetical protein